MALLPDLSALDKHRSLPALPDEWPGLVTLFSPVDDVHGALVDLIASANRSLIVAMYGFDDADLAAALLDKLNSGDVFVQLTLDKSQAAGAHEKELLSTYNFPASSVAVGHSERGAIMHLKMVVIDGVDVVTGSTNWSESAQTLQDNQLTVVRDPVLAAAARARLDLVHTSILAKQAAAG